MEKYRAPSSEGSAGLSSFCGARVCTWWGVPGRRSRTGRSGRTRGSVWSCCWCLCYCGGHTRRRNQSTKVGMHHELPHQTAGMTWRCFGSYLHTFRETKASTAWMAKAAHHLQQRHATTVTGFHTKQQICGHFCVWTAGSNIIILTLKSVSQPVPAAPAHRFINIIEFFVRFTVKDVCLLRRTSPPLV